VRSAPPRAEGVRRAALVICCLGPAALVTAGAWRDPSRLSPGTGGDTFKFMAFLAWVPHALASLQNPFWMPVIDHPAGVNLAWETSVSLGAVAVWPFQAGFGPVVAYNVFIFLTLVLDVACSYLWLRRHVRSAWAAMPAALIFGFGPWIGVHLIHANLLAFWPLPLLFITVEDVLAVRGSALRLGLQAGALVAVQLYLAEELVALAAIALLTALPIGAAIGPRPWPDLRRLAGSGSVGIALASLLGAPMLLFQLLGPRAVHGAIQPPNVYVADLQSFVFGTLKTWLWPSSLNASQSWTGLGEATAYVGLPLLLVAAVVAWRTRRDPVLRTLAASSVALAVLSLGPHLHLGGIDTGLRLPAALFNRLPLLDNLLPVRISILTDFGVALLAAVAIDAALTDRRTLSRAAAGLALLGIAAVIVRVPAPATHAVIPAYFDRGGAAGRLPAGTVALVGPYIDDGEADAVPMLWLAESDFKFSLIDGFAITVNPDGHVTWLPDNPVKAVFHELQATGATPAETPAERASLLGELHARGVNLIVLGPMPHRSEAVAFVSWLVGAPPQQVEGVQLWPGLPASP